MKIARGANSDGEAQSAEQMVFDRVFHFTAMVLGLGRQNCGYRLIVAFMKKLYYDPLGPAMDVLAILVEILARDCFFLAPALCRMKNRNRARTLATNLLPLFSNSQAGPELGPFCYHRG
jgi:hypothetical protein